MLFSLFSGYLQRLESISSRLEMTAVLAELFQELKPDEVAETCYLLQGQLLPTYESLEFQVSVKTVIKALARITPSISDGTLFGDTNFSKQENEIEQHYKKLGDLGIVAEHVVPKSGRENISLKEVYTELLLIAQDSGAQSQQRKLDAFVSLLQKVDPISAKFIIRIILGRLRLGFSDMTMMDGMSWAMTGTKNEHDVLEQAYQKKADIGKLAEVYLYQKDSQQRADALLQTHVEVGVPVVPELCQRLNSAAEMIEKMHDVIAEPKYDGLRVQIHVWRDKEKGLQYRTFTRNLEETSHMFPELADALPTLHCESCILDAEAIGYEVESGELLPFQVTIQRKRKYDVSEKAKEVPIRFYVFDILYLNGEDCIQVPLNERKEKLYTV